jgi:hypothetical protein
MGAEVEVKSNYKRVKVALLTLAMADVFYIRTPDGLYFIVFFSQENLPFVLFVIYLAYNML